MNDQEFINYIDEEAKRRELHLADKRPLMRAHLRQNGIERVEAEYDGFGDEGNVENILFYPDGKTLPKEQIEQLQDYIWAAVWNLNPGFENDEGGYGRFNWIIADDEIDVTQNTRTIHEEHEYYKHV